MKCFFVLNHPAHFHLFKHTIAGLKKKGHSCFIFIRPKDVLEELLLTSGIAYEVLTKSQNHRKLIIGSSIWGLIKKEFALANKIIKNRPNLLIGTDWAIVHLGRLFGIPSLVFNEDDTVATPENKAFYPFANLLILPECCDKGLWGKKRISYNGYHELAYLNRLRFFPNENIVSSYSKILKPFIILRLVKLTASHDQGKKGLGYDLIKTIIEKYRDKYDFLLTTEKNEPSAYSTYNYSLNPSLIHHFIAAATLVIGDSQTMIAEAAVLGTPALRFNDFIGKLSYLEELEHRYGLTYGIGTDKPEQLIAKAGELLSMKKLKQEWKERRQKMLSEKIDVTRFYIWVIENYPKSVHILHSDPAYQYKFMESLL